MAALPIMVGRKSRRAAELPSQCNEIAPDLSHTARVPPRGFRFALN